MQFLNMITQKDAKTRNGNRESCNPLERTRARDGV